jgi:NAD-dependent DNA ligase
MQINIPTNCPSCNSSLVLVNDLLYCRNPDCGSMSRKRVEHFATTLKIKGLGPAAVEKLQLSSPLDIYNMTLEYIFEGLNSEKLATKLLEEIEQSKSKRLNDLLPALGIPLIGKTATDKLSKVCTDIESITEQTCSEAGLGPKATENLITWLQDNDWYLFLPHDLSFGSTRTTSQANNGVVCITGKLNSFKTKAEAQVELERLGYVVKSSITKDVTILVNESGKETTKTQKARESGVIVITDLNLFIMENN